MGGNLEDKEENIINLGGNNERHGRSRGTIRDLGRTGGSREETWRTMRKPGDDNREIGDQAGNQSEIMEENLGMI